MNDALSALHHALIDALAARQHHKPGQPVTVAEIYQELVPYRTVRTTLGFALNADYEHALLKLLAGDGGFARIEPEEVQGELRLELTQSNPNVGIFRNYAACDVFIALPDDFARRREARSAAAPPAGAAAAASANPAAMTAPAAAAVAPANGAPADRPAAPAAAPARPPAPGVAAPLSGPSGAPATPGAASAPAVPRPASPPVAAVAGQAMVTGSCSACRRPLPTARAARFCPHCGHDQSRRTCARCHEPVEPVWKFCVACGSPT